MSRPRDVIVFTSRQTMLSVLGNTTKGAHDDQAPPTQTAVDGHRARRDGTRRHSDRPGGLEHTGAPAEKITRHDTDNVQSGNQTAPDPATPSSAAHRAVHGRHVASRTGERNGENPENSGETNTENGPSDGPSGHADPPGNVDHQFSGTE